MKIVSILLLTFLAFQMDGFGQINDLHISGVITDTSGNPIANNAVYLNTNIQNVGTCCLVLTDTNGFYNLHLNTSPFGGINDSVEIVATDCIDSIRQYINLTGLTNGDSIVVDLLYCVNATCKSSLLRNVDINTMTAFFDLIPNIPGSYSCVWNFGDGTVVSGGTQISHSYSVSQSYLVNVVATSPVCIIDTTIAIFIPPTPPYFNIFGQITDNQGLDLPNANITLWSDTNNSNLGIVRTFNSDSNGNFAENYIYLNFFSNYFALSFIDCNGDTTIESYPVPSNGSSIQTDLTYCGPTVCFGVLNKLSDELDATLTISNNLQFTYNYTWDFGDGTILSNALDSINHTYPSFNSYPLNISVNSALCNYVILDTIEIKPIEYSLNGLVYGGLTTIQSGLATLYKIDSTSTGINASFFDSSKINLGQYNLSGPNGNYFILVETDSLDPNHSNYFPTYYGGAIVWYNAQALIVNNNDLFNLDIQLQEVNALVSGIGEINGGVFVGFNGTPNPGTPISNVIIHLLDSANLPIKSNKTISNGEFKFQNLPYGSYFLRAEIPGVNSILAPVTLSAGQNSTQSVNFEYDSLGLSVIQNLSSEYDHQFTSYPNPTKDELFVKFKSAESKERIIEIKDVKGNVMSIHSTELDSFIIDVSQLKTGFYFIKIKEDHKLFIRRFLKE